MSFMYPRTISVYRPAPLVGLGPVAYGGVSHTPGTLIKAGMAANIQFKRAGGTPDTGLPSDPAGGAGSWRIFLDRRIATLGLILDRDIIIDDLGQRYVVVAAYWNSMGYAIIANILEA